MRPRVASLRREVMIKAFVVSFFSGILASIINPIRDWLNARRLANLRKDNARLEVELWKEKQRNKAIVHKAELENDIRYVQGAETDDEFIRRWKEVQGK